MPEKFSTTADAAEQRATHVVLPISSVAKLSRFLQRSIMEGQEAAEILNDLQKCPVINLEVPQEEAQ